MKVKPIILALICSIALKSIFFFRILNEPNLSITFGDPYEYYLLAQDILDGKYVSATRPPLYPIFLAIFLMIKDNIFGLVQLVQYLLGIMVGIGIYRFLLVENNIDEIKATLGFCAYSCNPVITLYESSFFSENLFIPFMFLAFLQFMKKRFFLTYIFLSLALLTRPVAMVFILIFVLQHVLIIMKRKASILSLSCTLIPLIPFLGFALYQKHIFGITFFSAIGEFSIGLYQANYIYAEQEKISINQARKEWLIIVYEKLSENDKKIVPFPDTSIFNKGYTAYWEYQQYPIITKVAFREALKLYIRNPIPTLKFIFKSMIVSMFNNGIYPMLLFFGINLDKNWRIKLLDSLLTMKFYNVFKLLKQLFLKYSFGFLFVLMFAFLYNILTSILILLLLFRIKNIHLSKILFLVNWFIAGFAGLGGVRYFIAGYPFLIIGALLFYTKEK